MKSVLYPYLLRLFDEEKVFVFDDERTGLKEEAFIRGMTEMIFRLVESKGIPNAGRGFQMVFGDEPFDHDVELKWLRPDEAGPEYGNWYRGTIAGEVMEEGWLCPALFCYFDSAPKRLYVRADPLPEGVDPIWHVDPDDPRQRRFVGPGDK